MAVTNLIFDLDGTLIDSSDGVVEAVNYSLRQMGQPEQPPELIKTFIGYPLSRMYPTFTEAPVEELYSHFQIKAAQTVVESTVILPGVEDVLTNLRDRGYRMAIASTKIKRHIDGIIEKFGWQEIMTSYAGGDEVNRVKPDPEILLLTLQRMGADSHETMVVGDTVNDVMAARAVPMKVMAVKSPYGREAELRQSGPDYFVDSIGELMDVLGKISKEAK